MTFGADEGPTVMTTCPTSYAGCVNMRSLLQKQELLVIDAKHAMRNTALRVKTGLHAFVPDDEASQHMCHVTLKCIQL